VLLGCKVVGTRMPGSSRVGLRQALVRNLMKYAMPPVAVFGLSDANGRHRGDVLAGTAVVIRVDDEGHNGSEADPDGESIEHSDEVGGSDESDEG